MKNLSRINTRFTDARLAELWRMWLLLFNERLSDFETFDPDLNATWANNIAQVLEQFEGSPNDENTLDELQQHTVNLQKAFDDLLTVVHNLEYFINLLYQAEPYRIKETGLPAFYRKRRGSSAEWLKSAEVLLLEATDRQAGLSGVGMPATLLPQLQAAITHVDATMKHQERFKLKRLSYTSQRILTYNQLYLLHRQLASAAANVYAHDPTQARLFEA